LVVVSIHDNVIKIIIIKHTIPAIAKVEGILEHKVKLRVEITNKVSSISVELHEGVSWSFVPRLIDRLKSIDSWVISPSLEELAYVIKSPVKVVLVDVVVAIGLTVPVTNPISGLDFPVAKVVIIDPFKVVCFTRVIKSILRIFKTVNIKENLNSILLSSIKEPLDVVGCSISASNIRSIRLKSPVSNR